MDVLRPGLPFRGTSPAGLSGRGLAPTHLTSLSFADSCANGMCASSYIYCELDYEPRPRVVAVASPERGLRKADQRHAEGGDARSSPPILLVRAVRYARC